MRTEGSESCGIVVVNGQRRIRLDQRRIESFVRQVAARVGLAGKDVEILFTGTARIRRLNRDFRGIDRVTDVLSFADAPPYEGGTIVIAPSVPRPERDTASARSEEIALLLVHGLLHLTGLDHPDAHVDETEMGRRQREILASFPAAARRGLVVSPDLCRQN